MHRDYKRKDNVPSLPSRNLLSIGGGDKTHLTLQGVGNTKKTRHMEPHILEEGELLESLDGLGALGWSRRYGTVFMDDTECW